jgi:hypothetical protein
LILDLAFFVVVLVILLNVFLGMIIDTFASLRAEKNERLRDTTEVCFICSIHKQIFDRASDEPDGFQTHIKIDHNMWNYLYFIFLLWEQDKDDDDGLEYYVRRCIEQDEIIWFPINKAMRLERVATKTEVLRKDLTDAIQDTETNLNGELDDFQRDLNGILHGLMKTLKQENNHYDSTTGTANAASNRDHGLLSYHGDYGLGNSGGNNNGIEEDMIDDLTLASESSYLMDLFAGKNIQVAIERIEGLAGLSGDQMTSVSVRIILLDSGNVIFIHSKSFNEDGNEVYFDASQFHLTYENVQSKDKRVLQIQILAGEGRMMNTLATIDLKSIDLLTNNPDPTTISKRFMQVGQHGLCVISFVVKCAGS